MSFSIQRILRAALFCITPDGWGVPLFLWGPSGAGKTKLIKAQAKAVNMPYIRLSPAERGEGQFGVVPVPGENALVLHYPPPDWVTKFANDGIIFADEINLGGPALQAPMLGLVQLRTLGSHEFGPRVRILAAANELDQATGGWELGLSLSNRFVHLTFEGLPPAEWTAGLMNGFTDVVEALASGSAEAEERRVTEAWPEAITWARSLVAAFIHRKPDLLYVEPKPGSADHAWPTRRTWETVTVLLAASRVHGLTDVETDALVRGAIGQAAAVEFSTFCSDMDLPDPRDVLDGRVVFQHEADRIDRTFAVLTSLAATITGDSKINTAWVDRMFTLMHTIASDGAVHVVVPASKPLMRPEIYQRSQPARAFLDYILPITQATGLSQN